MLAGILQKNVTYRGTRRKSIIIVSELLLGKLGNYCFRANRQEFSPYYRDTAVLDFRSEKRDARVRLKKKLSVTV